MANTADYGGAMYVNDYTNPGTCSSTTIERRYAYGNSECFIQVLAPTSLSWQAGPLYTTTVISIQNYAAVSGSALYGGLLDRCVVNPFTEVYLKYSKNFDSPISNKLSIDGVSYLRNVTYTDLVEEAISSRPLQVCFCINSAKNCSYRQPLYVQVKKGETFTVQLTAVDQAGHSISDAVIQTHLSYKNSTGSLAEGQLTQQIHKVCTDLTFNIYSYNSSEELTLYAANGPCKDAELSTRKVNVHFLPCTCPTGFQPSDVDERNCVCECHKDLSQYVKCNATTESFVRQSNVWISSVTYNHTEHTRYVVYPHCPYDYCIPISRSTSVDLNQPNGADAQCAFNRTGLLCGSCQPGLSMSLGSSRCLSCPDNWPALFISITIAAMLAGIALVILLLVLNMTVAVGTLNGFIFYANIVIANRSILLPFSKPTYVTVFISWLNLEL